MSEVETLITDHTKSHLHRSSKGKEPAGSHVDTRERRHRELALHHAQLVQQRRQAEIDILATTEELLDFPADSNADPLHPSVEDARHVLAALQPFQPADYDALIEERTINKVCGYVLCPRPPRSENTSAKYRILRDVDAGRGAFKIVSRADLEKWCSDACAKRALYLRVQMRETPAWERTGNGVQLELFRDDVQHRDSSDLGKLMNDFDKLALERGDASATAASFRANAVQSGAIVEWFPYGTTPPFSPTSPLATQSSTSGSARARAGSLSSDLERLKLNTSTADDAMETK